MEIIDEALDIISKYGLSTGMTIILSFCLIWLTYAIIVYIIIPFSKAHLEMVREIRDSIYKLSGSYNMLGSDVEEIKIDVTDIRENITAIKTKQETITRNIDEMRKGQIDLIKDIGEIKGGLQ